MAIGETIMGAALQVAFEKLASPEAINFFCRSKIDQSLFDKLKTLMLTADKLLLDAELKRILDAEQKHKNFHAVEQWLNELKHCFYRAEEVMDEIATEAMQSSLKSSLETPSLASKVRKLVPRFSGSSTFNRKITVSMREIVSMLENMLAQKDALGLRELSGDGTLPRLSRETASALEDPKVYGRDQESEKLLKLLLSDQEAEGKCFGVVPIVGMGGLGKTTLAKMVFNDARVQPAFDLKAWVCVSDQFDIRGITKSIIQSVTNNKCSSSLDLEFLQNKLRSELWNKKFFFVLDDVWNENYEQWQTLQAPFCAGANGSKIVVTTRNESVASTMGAKSRFLINHLSNDDAWSLFSRHAFELGNVTPSPCLEHTGRKIVQKCKGLPLSIKALGGLLRSKHDSKYWEGILQSSLWDLAYAKSNVGPALWLSYYHLPGYLKPCFSYCAIFPKDSKIDRKQLVRLWMAENFVAADGRRRMEDEGDKYLDELVSRSFLEPMDESYVTMHDLIHDLAQSFSGNFLVRYEPESTLERCERARHFSYVADTYDTITKFQAIEETKYLRSFLRLPQEWNFPSYLTNKVATILNPSLSCLRVLCLSGYQELMLPDLIECPKQLRYLDVSRTSIKHLPKWVSSLCNLQTLIASHCEHLQRLPAEMWRLDSLCHLDIRGAKLLSHMPEQMGKLRSLQTLTDFVVGENIGSGIQELRQLRHIHGKFAIRKLHNVTVPADAYLVCNKFIEDLELEFDNRYEDSEKDREVLENLKPPSDVKRLTIRNYGGTAFPMWLGRAYYKEIQSLCLSNCRYCIAFPPLGQLPSLKTLEIEGMNCVITLGYEFYGHDTCGPFSSLESLSLKSMKSWEVWSNIDAEGGAVCFPRLKHLSLCDCPNLKGNLPVNLPSLLTLTIEGCLQLSRLLPWVPSVRALHQATYLWPHAEFPKELNSLRNTKRSKVCSNVDVEGGAVCFPHLKKLSLYNCPNLKGTLSIHLPSLVELEIDECMQLSSILPRAPSNYVLELAACSRAELASAFITRLSLRRLLHLVTLPTEVVMLSSLSNLSISLCANLKSLSNARLPSTVEFLRISSCDVLECLPEGMEFLTHLQYLHLTSCPHLKWDPRDSLPTSLRTLWVKNCERWEFPIPIGRMQDYTTLDSLVFWGMGSSLVSFPLGIFPNLRSLKFLSCRGLEKVYIPQGIEDDMLTSLNLINIEGCGALEILGKDIARREATLLPASNLVELNIFGCENVKPVLLESQGQVLLPKLTGLIIDKSNSRKITSESPLTLRRSLFRFSCLTWLTITGEEMECFPSADEGWGSLPTSLRSLSIKDCPKLRRVDGKALQTFASLEKLYIWGCPKLERLPEEGLPPSLGELCIRGCPMLEERYKPKTGRDWSKISHIPRVKFGSN